MWFFSKKVSIEPLLGDMVDIHSHLLYGVDDGARTKGDTIEIIKHYQALGINKCYATPHILPGLFDNDEAELRKAFEERLLPIAKEMNFTVELAAEYMICPTFVQRLRDNHEFLRLGKSNYLLVEFKSHNSLSHIQLNIFDEIREKDYIPVLAHPERYHFIDKQTCKMLKERGVCMQLNLLSLSGGYGKQAKEHAEWQLLAGLYDFVGVDCHTIDSLKGVKKIRLRPKMVLKLRELISNNVNEFEY